MVHRINPMLAGLALGLALFVPQHAAAATENGAAPEYSGAAPGGLASRDAEPGGGRARLLMAQYDPPPDDGVSSDPRSALRQELDRIRQKPGSDNGSFDPPLPVRKKSAQASEDQEEAGGQAAVSGNTRAGRFTGRLVLLSFKGSQSSDPGPRAIRALLQSGLIAGAIFGRDNIHSKAQLKELMKFLWSGPAQSRPVFAIREIGGVSDPFPAIKDFERWPSEKDVAAKGDPQYAYSTYRSMGANLAGLGFNMNLGPVLSASASAEEPDASFGTDPLLTGVFAKTFILGHREENVIAVPTVDSTGHSVRALKTLLVSNPGIPINSRSNGAAPFIAYVGLVRGAKFCFAAATAGDRGEEAMNSFRRGCDMVIVDGGSENPAAVRDQIAQGLSLAVQNGEMTLEGLNVAAARIAQLRAAAHGE